MTGPSCDQGIPTWRRLQSHSPPRQASSDGPSPSCGSPAHLEWPCASPLGAQRQSGLLPGDFGRFALNSVHRTSGRHISASPCVSGLAVAPKGSLRAQPHTPFSETSASEQVVTDGVRLGPRLLCHSALSAYENKHSPSSLDRKPGHSLAPSDGRGQPPDQGKIVSCDRTPSVDQAHHSWAADQGFTPSVSGAGNTRRPKEREATGAVSTVAYHDERGTLARSFSVSAWDAGQDSKLLSDLMSQERHLLAHFARQHEASASALSAPREAEASMRSASCVWVRAHSAGGVSPVPAHNENSFHLPSAMVSLVPSTLSFTDPRVNLLTLADGSSVLAGTGRYGISNTITSGVEPPGASDADVAAVPYGDSSNFGMATPVSANVINSPVLSKHHRRPQPTLGAGRLLCRGREQKAVIVGCNYHVSHPYHLRGSANDAHLFAHACVQLLKFDPRSICLITDSAPSTCYRGQSDSDGSFFGPSHRRSRASMPGVAEGPVPSGKQVASAGGSSASQVVAERAPAGFADFLRLGGRSRVSGSVTHPVVDVDRIEGEERYPVADDLPTRHNILK